MPKKQPTLPEILPPIYDLIFKLVFAMRPDLLRQLLQALIDLPPGEFGRIKVVDPHVYPDVVGGKQGVLDIKVTLRSKKTVNVEMQREKFTHIRERVLYYCAGMIKEQVVKGDKYGKIKRVVSITITNHVVIPEDNEYHHRYTLFDPKTGSEFTDLLEVHLIELPKMPQTGDGSDMWWWMKFMTINTKEGLDMIVKKKPSLKKAAERLWTVSVDNSVRARLASIEKYEMDQRTLRSEAVEEGLEEGLKKGMRKGMQQGMQKGMQQGMQKGMQKGAEAERRRIAGLINRGASIDTIKKALAKQTTRPTKKRTANARAR